MGRCQQRCLPASADPPSGLRLHGFSADGNQLRAYTNRHVVLDATTGRVMRTCAAAESNYLGAASMSTDEGLLAVPRSKELLLVNARTGKEVRRLGVADGYVGRHFFAGQHLFTYGGDNVVRIWDLGKVAPIQELKDPSNSNLLAASPDGRYFSAAPFGQREADDHDVRLWEVASGKLLHRLTPRLGAAYRLQFAPDGEMLAIVTAPPSSNPGGEAVSVVSVRSGKEIAAMLFPDKGGVNCLAFSPDGRTLATGADDAAGVRLWELAGGKQRHHFTGHRHQIESLVFSSDGTRLASSSIEAPAYVWDVYGKHGQAPPESWTDDERQRLWQALAGPNAQAAFAAIRRLVRNPGPAVALLRERCRPAEAVDGKRLRQWLQELDSDDFNVRAAASAELERLGDRIETALSAATRGSMSLEAKRRAAALLAKLDPAAPGASAACALWRRWSRPPRPRLANSSRCSPLANRTHV